MDDIQKSFLECAELVDKCLSSYKAQDHQELIGLIKLSNMDNGRMAPMYGNLLGKVKRWDISKDKILVSSNGDLRVERALDLLEKLFERSVFERNVPTAKIENDKGLIFSFGTAAPMPGAKPDRNCKGSVGKSKNSGETPYDLCDPKDGTFIKPLYVNLDGPPPYGGTADLAVTLHELAHALGLGDEFKGFGKGGPPISALMFSTLKKLYELPVGRAIPVSAA